MCGGRNSAGLLYCWGSSSPLARKGRPLVNGWGVGQLNTTLVSNPRNAVLRGV